jgi:hypothetical protein
MPHHARGRESGETVRETCAASRQTTARGARMENDRAWSANGHPEPRTDALRHTSSERDTGHGVSANRQKSGPKQARQCATINTLVEAVDDAIGGSRAGVAEPVDAQVSKTCSFTGVSVRSRPPAPSAPLPTCERDRAPQNSKRSRTVTASTVLTLSATNLSPIAIRLCWQRDARRGSLRRTPTRRLDAHPRPRSSE